MATLLANKIKDTYKSLLKMATSGNNGIDGTFISVEDGDATASTLQLSSTGVKSTGTFEVTGASTLAAVSATTGTFSGTLGVTGLATFVNLNTTGTTTLGDSGDATTVNGTLGVTGATTLSTMTSGSVLFAGTAGLVSQDNANLFWDDTNNRLGIGTTGPTVALDVLSLGNFHAIRGTAVVAGYWGGLFYNSVTPAVEVALGGDVYAATFMGGNVGIGTTSPVAELQVGKASDVTIAMSNSSSVTSGNRGGLAWYNSSNSTVASIKAVAVTDNVGTELQFYTRPAAGSSTQVLTIASTGAATFSSSVTATSYITSSDMRLKNNIILADLNKCYDNIKNLPLKRYTWNDDCLTTEQAKDRNKLGWIAQDVQKVFSKSVFANKFEKIKQEDGFEEIEEDVFIETETEIEKKEIKLVDGKYKEVITKEIKKNKEQVFDEFDLFNEGGEVIGKHKVAKKQKVSKPKFKQDVIEDCLSLNADQIYAAMYGAVQLLIQKVEALEAK